MFARCLSLLKDERVEASHHLKGPVQTRYAGDKKEFAEHIHKVSGDRADFDNCSLPPTSLATSITGFQMVNYDI